jgi:hypothetical protein
MHWRFAWSFGMIQLREQNTKGRQACTFCYIVVESRSVNELLSLPAVCYKRQAEWLRVNIQQVSVEQQELNRRNMKCLVVFAMCAVAALASIPDGYAHGRYAFYGRYAGKSKQL